MPNKLWFVNIRGETFGPIGTPVVIGMLKENRLQFTDFLWAEGLTRWQRIQDLHEFAALIPPYPTNPIPGSSQTVSEIFEQPVRLAEPEPALRPAATEEKTGEIQKRVKSNSKNNPKAKFRRNARVHIDAKVSVEGHGTYEALDISGGGILLQGPSGIHISTDVKIRIEAKAFGKPLEMTGVVVREEDCGGHIEFAVEFTRVNPAHKRTIQDYVTQSLPEAA